LNSDDPPSYKQQSLHICLCETPEIENPPTKTQLQHQKNNPNNIKEEKNHTYQERKLWPKINKVTVGKDGVRLTKFLINKIHD
jgi:hypothetical protein